jgi:hypothetical protein
MFCFGGLAQSYIELEELFVTDGQSHRDVELLTCGQTLRGCTAATPPDVDIDSDFLKLHAFIPRTNNSAHSCSDSYQLAVFVLLDLLHRRQIFQSYHLRTIHQAHPTSSYSFIMHTLATLPDDILILICQHILLQDIFHLRQTARRLAALVLSYDIHISLSIARNTFPDANLLLRVPVGTHDFSWLKSLVPKFFAAVLVDKLRAASPDYFMDYYGVPAESEWGDGPRARVETGCRVFKRLSDISQEVYKLPDLRVPRRPLKERVSRAIRLRYRSVKVNDSALDLVERRERLVSKRRLVYLNDLDRQDIKDYVFMFTILLTAFETNYDGASVRYAPADKKTYDGPHNYDWGGDRGADTGKRIYHANSWVNSFLLNQGPMLFWHQWYSRKEDYEVKEVILRAWKERSKEQIQIERNATSSVEEALRFLSGKSSPYYLFSDEMVQPFVPYLKHRIPHLRTSPFVPVNEVMEDLPYWINFRTRQHG